MIYIYTLFIYSETLFYDFTNSTVLTVDSSFQNELFMYLLERVIRI